MKPGAVQVIDERYPGVDIHLALDNCRTHKHRVVKEWLAEHSRCQLHFTPTSASRRRRDGRHGR